MFVGHNYANVTSAIGTLYDPLNLLILIKSCCLPVNAEDSVVSSPTCYASGSFSCSSIEYSGMIVWLSLAILTFVTS